MSRQRLLPISLTITAALLWGSSFTVVKVGLRYFDPYSFVLLRFAAATVVLLAVLAGLRKLDEFVSAFTDRYAVLLGMVLAASFGFQFRGQVETTASKAAMIVNSSVVLVAPLSLVLLREQLGWRKIGALVVGMVGVYLITTTGSRDNVTPETTLGNILVSSSALCYAFYVVLTRMAVTRRPHGELPLIAAVFAWSLPFFLVASIGRSSFDAPRIAYLVVGYLAVFCSIIPFILWTAAIRHIGALTSAIMLLAELVFGVAIAAYFLKEALPPPVIAGCCLVFAGIAMVVSERQTDAGENQSTANTG